MYKCEKCKKDLEKEEFFKNEGLCNECGLGELTREVCPNCGSKAVSTVGNFAGGLGSIVVGLILMIFLYAVPILLIISIAMIVIGVIFIVSAPLSKTVACTCKTCNYRWVAKK